MSNDLISRSALIEECNELSAIEWNQKAAPVSWADAYEHFADDLENAPAVDAVEVVRCKDCAFYDFGECDNYRMDVSDGAHFYPYPDDFCSYGERRADDGK